MGKPKRVTCLFCGQQGEQAKEDVISKWINKELRPAGLVVSSSLRYALGQLPQAQDKVYGSHSSIKLRNVCKPCNNGWMRDIEEAARPTLLRLIRGQTATLAQPQKRLIAAWSQLHGIALDAHKDRYLAPYLAHDLCRTYQPLSASMVAIAPFAPPPRGTAVAHEVVSAAIDPSKTGVPNNKLAYIAFSFGRLFIRVVFDCEPGQDRLRQDLVPAGDSKLLVCWPLAVSGDLYWPPGHTLDYTAFFSLPSLLSGHELPPG